MEPEDNCRTCGEDASNGEGWDGECGNCADRTAQFERKKSDDTEGGSCD